jgi:hypothetical protein
MIGAPADGESAGDDQENEEGREELLHLYVCGG